MGFAMLYPSYGAGVQALSTLVEGTEHNMDDELTIVDAFEQLCGNKSAMDCANEFLIKYVSFRLDSIPEIARPGLDVAARYRKGSADLAELRIERAKLENFLRERSAWTGWADPDYGSVHSIHAVLWYLEEPTRGGGASEVISNVLEATKAFRPDDEIVKSLLSECFQAQSQ